MNDNEAAFTEGWLAAFDAVRKVLSGLAAESLVKPNSEVLSAFRAGQEAALLVAEHRVAAAALPVPEFSA